MTALALALTLLVYLTQVLAGWLVLAVLDGAAHRRLAERLARALLLGPAALAVQMLAMDALGLRFSLPAVLAPWWLAAALAAARLRRRAPDAGRDAARDVTPSAARLAVLGLAALLGLGALAQGLLLPVYTTDAMHNFAVEARVFETRASVAPGTLAELAVAGHTDYPPLVSFNESLVFLAAGEARALAIKPFFALAHLALLLLVIEACFRALTPLRAAALASFVLLSPFIGRQSMEGYADLRLTTTILLLALQAAELARDPTARRAVLFAACAGACALTKFEGLAVALAVAPLPLLLALKSARRVRMRRGGAGAGIAASGAASAACRAGPSWRAAAAATALLLALSLAWPAHLATRAGGAAPLAGAAWHDVARAVQRWPGAATGLLSLTAMRETNGDPASGLFWPVLGALAACGLLLRARRRAVAPWALALAAHFLLYATVVALSPSELQWQVATAGPRLLFHLAPWLLLAAIAALAEPRASRAVQPDSVAARVAPRASRTARAGPES